MSRNRQAYRPGPGVVRSWWRGVQWYFVVGAGLAALLLGSIGHWWYFRDQAMRPSLLDVLHPTLQLFVLNAGAVVHPNWALEIARFLAPLALGYTAAQAFLGLMRQHYRLARLRFAREHVVICGLGRKGLQLARDYRARGRRVVAIDSDEHNDHVRICRELGATVLTGDATHVELLMQARVGAASQVIATTGDDGVNVEILVHAYELFRARPRRMTHKLACLVHLVDAALCAALRQSPLFQDRLDRFEAQVFNIYENCARQLFEEHPLDRVPIGETSPLSVHLVIIGFGKMGQSVALQAARIGHFANGRKLRLTVVDHRARELREALLGGYPHFGQVCDLTFVRAEAGGATLNAKLNAWAVEPESLLSVVICLDNNSLSLTQALGVAEQVRGCDGAVLVRMEEDAGLASLLSCGATCHPAIRRIRAFGQIDRVCALEWITSDRQDRLARHLHSRYLEGARRDPAKQADDPALMGWVDLPESYRDANRRVADHAGVKLRAAGLAAGGAPARDFTDAETELLARMEHERWMADRLLAGWRYGPPPKSERHKTNPNMVPWGQLDEVNRDRDRQAVREMNWWLRNAGAAAQETREL